MDLRMFLSSIIFGYRRVDGYLYFRIKPFQWIDNKNCLANFELNNENYLIYLNLGNYDASDLGNGVPAHILRSLGTYQYTTTIGSINTGFCQDSCRS